MKNHFSFKPVQAVVSDMDGVLWHGPVPAPGLAHFFGFLKRRGIPIVLASNNSTATPAQYQQKLAGWDIQLELENILTCTLAVVDYLRREFRPGAGVYVVGEACLREAIRSAGFDLLESAKQPAAAVVVGGDSTLTYNKLKDASLLLQAGARFIGTNPDILCPTEEGLVPEAGTILAALQAASGLSPVIIGKPEHPLFDMAISRLGPSPGQIVMLGDRLDTDILGGQQAGLKTILLTTGVDDRRSIAQKGIQPDAIFGDLVELVDVWASQL